MITPYHRTVRLLNLLAGVLILAVASLSAQPRTGSTGASIDIDRIRADVKYLASDELEGRRAGSAGSLLAAGYIARRFEQLGLAVVPNGEGYYHRFGYVAGVRLGAHNKFLLFGPGTKSELVVGAEFNPMSFSEKGTVLGDLVFAGYGITAPEANYDDYAGIDVRGKLVVAMRYSPDGSGPHSGFASHMSFSAKVRNARDRGAAGIIFMNQPKDSAKLYPLRLDRSFINGGLPAFFALSTVFAGARDPSGRSLAEIQQAIDAQKAPASFVMEGYSASVAADVTVLRDSIPNVLAMLPGTDPRLRDEMIVIGAHYDHLGWGGEGSLHEKHDSAIHYGADDNASGTAGVLALAEYFAQTRNNRRTLVFMAFNGEEEGLLGSQSLMRNPPMPTASIISMMNMDMIGRLDSNTLVLHGIGSSPAWEPLVKEINRGRFNLKLVQDGFGPSDHASFYAKDIPVLFFFTNLHEDYHRPGDTWDKVNYEGEVAVLGYVADIIAAVDRMNERPKFTKVAVTAGARSSGGFKVYVGTIPDYAYEGKGLRLNGVSEGGPAAKAGLKSGDVIVRMGDRPIDNIYDYTDALGRFEPKQEVETEYLRDGVTMNATIVMGSR